jgi:voltage-gated potassium channel
MANPDRIDEIKWQAQSEDGQVMLGLTWEIFVLAVTSLSILNIFLAIFVRDPNTTQVIFITDAILILIFGIDFLRRLRVADDVRAYLTKGWGWLDIISIIPMLRIARILRIIRVTRVLQRMGGVGPAMSAFFANRASGGLLLVFFIAILVLEFGSLTVLFAERDAPGASILTARDAVWYLIVTMSTVGYGDLVPVTDLGRVIGTVIIVVGVGVFGTLTGFLATIFTASSGNDAEAPVSPAAAPPESVATRTDVAEQPAS